MAPVPIKLLWAVPMFLIALSAVAAPAPSVQCAVGGMKPADRQAACTAALADNSRPAPERAVLLLDRAFAELDQKNDSGVLADTGAALDLDPGQWPAHWLRAEALERGRDFPAAASSWRPLVDRFPDQLEPRRRLGLALYNSGEAGEAIPILTKAIDIGGASTQLGRALLDRGLAEAALEQNDSAFADFDKAIARNDPPDDALFARGRLHYLQGDWADAVADFTKATAESPRHKTYAGLWLYLALARNHADGKSELRRVAPADRKPWPGPIVAFYLGETTEDAVTVPVHEKARDTARDECERAFYLAEMALFKGNRETAVRLFHQAVATGITEYREYWASRTELRKLSS